MHDLQYRRQHKAGGTGYTDNGGRVTQNTHLPDLPITLPSAGLCLTCRGPTYLHASWALFSTQRYVYCLRLSSVCFRQFAFRRLRLILQLINSNKHEGYMVAALAVNRYSFLAIKSNHIKSSLFLCCAKLIVRNLVIK